MVEKSFDWLVLPCPKYPIWCPMEMKEKKKSNEIENNAKYWWILFKTPALESNPLVVSNSAKSYAMVINHLSHHPNVMSETFGIVL